MLARRQLLQLLDVDALHATMRFTAVRFFAVISSVSATHELLAEEFGDHADCPWLNGTSNHENVLICMNGHRCNWLHLGFDCCDCHGGRAKCPHGSRMCNSTTCGSGAGDYCCDDVCEVERPCPSPPAPAVHTCSPPPPSPPPQPTSCNSTCGKLHCSALLSLSCDVALEVWTTIGCVDACSGCCSYFPPTLPPPSSPPPVVYTLAECPWRNGTSGEADILVCMDGYRCNWNYEGPGCCNCHGGRALCPIDRKMCDTPDANRSSYSYSYDEHGARCGNDHCCIPDGDSCEPLGGDRPCPSEAAPISCTPPLPPSPPAPPISPPPPSACDRSCTMASGQLECSSLSVLTCEEVGEVSKSIGCHHCNGCCTSLPPSPPPPLNPPSPTTISDIRDTAFGAALVVPLLFILVCIIGAGYYRYTRIQRQREELLRESERRRVVEMQGLASRRRRSAEALERFYDELEHFIKVTASGFKVATGDVQHNASS